MSSGNLYFSNQDHNMGEECLPKTANSLSRYCTSRSISALESVGSEFDAFAVPLVPKGSIWSTNIGLVAFADSGKGGSRSNLYSSGNYSTASNCGSSDFFSFGDPAWRNVVPQAAPAISQGLFHKRSFSSTSTNSSSFPLTPTSPLNLQLQPTLQQIIESPKPQRQHPFPILQPESIIQRDQALPTILRFKSYDGLFFDAPPNSMFFVIKSYSILDVNASFLNNIWTSTELGNKRLHRAFVELSKVGSGKIFLLFSVNASGKFCGVAEMDGDIDFSKSSDIWAEQTRWKGIFPVKWLFIKDVPNRYFQGLRVPANANKSVTNSRDTQEIPFETGISMMKIISSFR